MNHSFSIFEVLVLIGMLQGTIMATLIWFYKRQSLSKRLLSGILIVFNLLCAKILIHTLGLWDYQYVRYFPLSFELLIQPLFYLYVTALVHVNFTLARKHFFHFIPFIIFIGFSLLVYILTLKTQNLSEKDAIANSLFFNEIKQIEDFLSIFSSIIYVSFGIKYISQYREWLNQNTSNTDYPTYSWLRNIIIFTCILIFSLTVAISIDTFFDWGIDIFIHWQIFFVYLAAVIYYLGFSGYAMKESNFNLKQLAIDQQDSFLIGATKNIPENISQGKNADSLSEERKLEIRDAILKALEHDKLYLDPELSTQKLAKKLNIGISSLSWVINNCFDKSFRNLINEYRVEEVKIKFKDPKSRVLSFIGIAYECGFNSEASFYRIFKSIVGVSPKTFYDQLNK